MPRKKLQPKPAGFVGVRLRFTAAELNVIRTAAANRGLGFNTFVRLVSAGVAKRILAETPPEELVGRFLDPDSVLLRVQDPSQAA